MDRPNGIVFRFGSYELDVGNHLLTRGGTRVSITPKAFQALQVLLERAGQLVPKDDLMQALWPESFVEEANLSVQIAAIRKILGRDSGCELIETVPTRGYRFTGRVEPHQRRLPASVPRKRDPARLIVLPLRLLESRTETRFLAFSLADALAGSLARLPNVVVRSPLAAQRQGAGDTDLAVLAGAAQVDFALIGTLADLGGDVGVTLQLVDLPDGTVRWSDSVSAPADRLFDLHEELAARVARALPIDTPRQTALPRDIDVPTDAGAYVFFLRANQLAYETSQWLHARDLYLECLARDPDYAPAWARLARCYRVIGKFATSVADARQNQELSRKAFDRALALNPDLSIAHNLYSQLEVDLGRAVDAMRRLLDRLRRNRSDPECCAGLVHALRFCGLLDESLAAHRRARELDPGIPTSIHHTYWMMGEYLQALSETQGDIGYMPGLALTSMGRDAEAVATLQWRERETQDDRARTYIMSLRTLLEGRRDAALTALDQASSAAIDGEARYYLARSWARLGGTERALRELRRVVDDGFHCHATFALDPWLESIRSSEEFQTLLARARAASDAARETFRASGGLALLGL